MIIPMAAPASAIRADDLVFYCEKRDVGGWLIVESAAPDGDRVSVAGRCYPDVMGNRITVDLGAREYVGIVRGVAADQFATFEQAQRLAGEAGL